MGYPKESITEGKLKLPSISKNKSDGSPESKKRLKSPNQPNSRPATHQLPPRTPRIKVPRPPTIPRPPADQPGLVIVKYGKNKQAILNTFCQNLHLLNFIKELTGCRPVERIDLMSWRGGEMQNISKNRYDYAYQYLKSRETYLLVKLVYDNHENLPVYTSMLDEIEAINPNLADKLETLSKPAKALMVKSKWSNVSRKSLDHSGQTERKSGLNTILAKEKGKMGIMGLIAAMKEKEDADNSSKAEDVGLSSAGLKRLNKLPSLTQHSR